MYAVPNNNVSTISGEDGFFSKMLTVWRKVHLEIDSMGTAPSTGDEKNYVSGEISNVSVSVEADVFWVMYLLGSYQAGWNEDYDPNNEEHSAAGQTSTDYQGGLIFLESIRDYSVAYNKNLTTLERQAVAHELGHQFGINGHTFDTIMSIGLPVSTSYEKFSVSDIQTIRGSAQSPGNR